MPADFTVLDANVVSVPAGETWNASFSGTAPTQVTFSLGSGGGGIQLLQAAELEVQVMPMTAIASAWTTSGHTGKYCTSPDVGPPLLPLQPFVIIPGPTPTATPTPTPTDTSTATPTPSPTATDRDADPQPHGHAHRDADRGSIALAHADARSDGGSHRGDARPTRPPRHPRRSRRPSPLPRHRPRPASRASGLGDHRRRGSERWGHRRSATPRADTPISIGELGSIDAMGFAWLVPGALLGLPGLLLLLIIGAQAGLASLFVTLTGRAMPEQETAPIA